MPAVNVILDSLGVAEETPPVWEGAEEPRPVDVMILETDYVLGSGDVVRVAIYELLREAELFINDYVVTETGKISIPEIGVVQAAGFTESQLEEELRQILEPGILKGPSVTVTLLRSERRTFSIWGQAVPLPGRYFIPRYDFRLTDALATAGGISQFNVSNIYVSRPVTGEEAVPTEPAGEPEIGRLREAEKELLVPEQELLEMVTPHAGPASSLPDSTKQHPRQWSQNELVVASAEMVTDRELAEAALPEGFERSTHDKADPAETEMEDVLEALRKSLARKMVDESAIEKPDRGRIEWIFQDGRWVPIRVGRPRRAEPPVGVEPVRKAEPLREMVPEDFGWAEIGAGGVQTRVIRIPADKLRGGDPRYNIVVKRGDSIHIPVDIIGEFSIMGNVNRTGFINLTGRPMTLMMAIAAAGGLGPTAWPKRCEVRRRLGEDREEIVMVDLERIARGEQPDFFIKPDDLVNVGTHPTSTWRFILRNAFRATYGFGFIYDRNFADRDFGTRRPIPDIF
jgi:protein involved in polysaccharide export with SLBB domain